jgi:hypothetical protein
MMERRRPRLPEKMEHGRPRPRPLGVTEKPRSAGVPARAGGVRRFVSLGALALNYGCCNSN